MTEQPTKGSPNNSGKRIQPITAIVMHDTMGHNVQGTLSWFADKASQVSSHVVIDKDGLIYRVVPDDHVAWHAGVSSLFGATGVNAFSLGVELVDDNDNDPYPLPQWLAATQWVAAKAIQYGVPLNRIVGHQHIAPGRKVDPGKDFDWHDFMLDVAKGVLG